jgi:hypothetical protein
MRTIRYEICTSAIDHSLFDSHEAFSTQNDRTVVRGARFDHLLATKLLLPDVIHS